MHDHTEFLGVSLRFDEREVFLDSDEPNRYVHRFHGEVLRLNDDHADDVIGSFQAIYVDVESANDDSTCVFEVFDAAGQSEYDYFKALYTPDGEVLGAVQDLIYGKGNAWWAPNLLILELLEILPAHRGKGIGLVALWGLMRTLGLGAGLVAMMPFPLQCKPKPDDENGKARWDALQLDALPRDKRRATAALRRYYKRLGFKALRGTDYMIRNAMEKLPALESLIRPK